MATPTLRYTPGAGGVVVDLERLVASRLLVQANSGGGKSRALRQLLEETHGRIPHLVIDPEGEFATLRERFDYVLAAKSGGDVVASAKTAKLLCRRLVELGASAVLDLYELPIHERREFVKLFVAELVALPRALWRPYLVVIDELHHFAPERGSGESQSTEAVIALATLGRKRGFALVGATQRISKLHKDCAAELLNKMIGRTGLDVDLKRAGDELGLDKEARAELRSLAPGEFFVYGPAISSVVTRVRTGAVVTSHPQAGRVGTAPPPAPAKVKALLSKLVDLPQEAEQEARTVADLQRQLAESQRKLRQAEKGAPSIDRAEVDRQIVAAVEKARERWTRDLRSAAGREVRALDGAIAAAVQRVAAVVPAFNRLEQLLGAPAAAAESTPAPREAPPARSTPRRATPAATPGDTTLGKGERAVLIAIASYDEGVERDQLSVLTGYKRSSRDTYVQRLSSAGLVSIEAGKIIATDAGIAALGDDYEPLPTGRALREYWMERLPEGEAKVLGVIVDAYPDTVRRDAIDDATGYKRSSRDTYIQRLMSRRLVVKAGASEVRASTTLFDK